jgi:hypothetical protein
MLMKVVNGGFSVEVVERSLLSNEGVEDFVDVINAGHAIWKPLPGDGACDMAFGSN